MSLVQNIPGKESFRDSVATISKEGKRNYIHPKKPRGKFYNLRTWFSIFYLVVFFTLPFIKVNGGPLLMINILERKFILSLFSFINFCRAFNLNPYHPCRNIGQNKT